jgi:hypothetical protein
MMTAANFMMNQERGVVAGWKIREFTLLRDPLKHGYDSGSEDPRKAVAKCDLSAMPIAIRVRDSRQKLWGMSFDELQQQHFEKLKVIVGL